MGYTKYDCFCFFKHVERNGVSNPVVKAQNRSGLTHHRAAKLPVLFQPYLLQVMYMTCQYLTVSCIPAVGYVPNISRYGT